MLDRIVRVSLPVVALLVASGLTVRPSSGPKVLTTVLAASSPQAQAPAVFTAQCAGCHGEEGLGTAKGPALAMNQRVAEQSADQLAAYLQRGNLAAGMPSFADLTDTDRATLARYLLRINVETITKPAPLAATARRRRGVRPNRETGAPTTAPIPAIATAHSSRSRPANVVHAQAEVGVPHSVFRARDNAAGGGRRAVRHRARTRCSRSTP